MEYNRGSSAANSVKDRKMVTYSFTDGNRDIRGFVDLNVEYVTYEYFSEWFAKNHPGKNLRGFMVHTNRESWLSLCDFISKVSNRTV